MMPYRREPPLPDTEGSRVRDNGTGRQGTVIAYYPAKLIVIWDGATAEETVDARRLEVLPVTHGSDDGYV